MPDKQDRSIGELFSELASETGLLIRQEIALAKVELSQKATRVGRNVGYLVLGGAVAYAALLALLAAVIILLANYMPSWVAALVVAVLVGIVGAVLISKALADLKKTDVAPRQTVETLKEDAQWAKQQMK
ncbi:MAG: phage holin family protein [Acidobacteriaceae bacterium]|nr:phage holin family protein [Acidobacteriaceae bacterium]MBV9225886.1 phage holin family protein [Acidobacteriaceae bacterium]MBV9678480.1 phage holin family protein [Acidobacteriaceae bacterium]MBV9937204.1 phage holin family protein [Acidobacteriaceae bacterium]